jgi:thiaminase
MSVARMDELVKVFLDVVELEIGFWDEVIDQ